MADEQAPQLTGTAATGHLDLAQQYLVTGVWLEKNGMPWTARCCGSLHDWHRAEASLLVRRSRGDTVTYGFAGRRPRADFVDFHDAISHAHDVERLFGEDLSATCVADPEGPPEVVRRALLAHIPVLALCAHLRAVARRVDRGRDVEEWVQRERVRIESATTRPSPTGRRDRPPTAGRTPPRALR